MAKEWYKLFVMALEIGGAIASLFRTGRGTIGCFLQCTFDGVNCRIALTAAHVLFSHPTDFSARQASRATAKGSGAESLELVEAKEQTPFAKKATEAIQTAKGSKSVDTRDAYLAWAISHPDFKSGWKGAIEGKSPQEPLAKAIFRPGGFESGTLIVPFVVRTTTETDWGLAIVPNTVQYDNRAPYHATNVGQPIKQPKQWITWRPAAKGEKVFKCGQNTGYTEGMIGEVNDRGFTVKNEHGSKFSGEGDSGAGVFAMPKEETCELLGLICRGGSVSGDGTTEAVGMGIIAKELERQYCVANLAAAQQHS
jgi:hypothetical protein